MGFRSQGCDPVVGGLGERIACGKLGLGMQNMGCGLRRRELVRVVGSGNRRCRAVLSCCTRPAMGSGWRPSLIVDPERIAKVGEFWEIF